jgi:hypothetical protein
MKRFARLFGVSLLLVVLAVPFITSIAAAHGQTSVGDYGIEIGFHNEPAYVNEPNALDLIVTNSKTNEKVTGLEDTLQAEIIFGSSKKTLKVEATEEDGVYTAYVVPTAVGDYTWHIFGKIKDTPVDISMTSSPTTFNSVETMDDYEFPAPASTSSDMQAQMAAITKSSSDAAAATQAANAATQAANAATQAATAAAQSAQTALIVGIVGVVLGVIGIGVGFMARRSGNAAKS